MELAIDEKLHAILPSEAFDQTLRMLRHAVSERARHANVEHAIGFAGEDIDAGMQSQNGPGD